MAQQYRVLLFTDQVDSTRLTALRTPEQIRSVAREQTALTVKAVSACGGEILKDTGDGHLVSFSMTASAIRCGWLIQSFVRERSAGARGTPGDFELRVGIDSGLVEVLPNEDVRGDPANRAARICSECPGGEVYCSESVRSQVVSTDAEFESCGHAALRGFDASIPIYRVVRWMGQPAPLDNPFIWRTGIGDPDLFTGRANELRRLIDYARGGQSCQVLGPRRIGKSSLLKRLELQLPDTIPGARPIYLSAQDPRCRTQLELLGYLLPRLGADRGAPIHQSTLSAAVETMVRAGCRPVLLLDEFEDALSRSAEYDRDFLLTLRYCSELGLSMVTSTRRPLHELTDPNNSTSPFFNVFARLDVGLLTARDAEQFVQSYRLGSPRFTEAEQARILSFAGRHPLALQIASYHVLETRVTSHDLETALEEANQELATALPSWPEWRR